MNLIKNIYFLAVLLLISSSCSSDEDPEEILSFTFSRLQEGDIIAYTKSGVIQDQEIMNAIREEFDKFMDSYESELTNTDNYHYSGLHGYPVNLISYLVDTTTKVEITGNNSTIRTNNLPLIRINNLSFDFDYHEGNDGLIRFIELDTSIRAKVDVSTPCPRITEYSPLYQEDDVLEKIGGVDISHSYRGS